MYGLPIPKNVPYDRFKFDERSKNLYWTPKEGVELSVKNSRGVGDFLSLRTIAKNYGYGGHQAINKFMNLENYTSQTRKIVKLSPEAEENVEQAIDNLPEGSVEITPAVADQAVASAQNILAVFLREGYTPRDIQDMCKSLERSRGELTNNLAKLSELDKDIAEKRSELEEATDETDKDHIAKRLRELQDERASRLEAASATRKALRSQISRIRETLHRILHEDKTLAERIKTLFREQGITIMSVLTALRMIISTIVLAIPGGGAAAPPQPPQPSGKGGAKEWLKNISKASEESWLNWLARRPPPSRGSLARSSPGSCLSSGKPRSGYLVICGPFFWL